MFCTKCGAKNADDNRFCVSCGATMVVPADFQVNSQAQARPTVTDGATMSILKSLAASPLLMIAMVAFTASVLINFIVSLAYSGSANSLIMGIPMNVNINLKDGLSGSYTFSMLLSIAPAVLTAIGMWITYLGVSGKLATGISTAGLTIIRVINIIYLVLINIIMAVCELLLISDADAFDDIIDDTPGILVVLLLIFIALHVFLNVFYCKIIKTVNTIKGTLITGVPSADVSTFVAVMCFISAFYSFCSLFDNNLRLLNVIQILLTIAVTACFGAFIYIYKNKMQSLAFTPKGNYNQTANAQQAQVKQQTGEAPVQQESKTVYCEYCGQPYSASADSCPYCGSENK